MSARYHDPVIGRFYSNDPIGFRDVNSFNRYAYANNNPYLNTDPTGLAACNSTGSHIEGQSGIFCYSSGGYGPESTSGTMMEKHDAMNDAGNAASY